jgi:hypothetical protein
MQALSRECLTYFVPFPGTSAQEEAPAKEKATTTENRHLSSSVFSVYSVGKKISYPESMLPRLAFAYLRVLRGSN